jgi:hypothetical protein
VRKLIEIDGQKVQLEGKLLRVARLDAEKFLFLDNPEQIVEGLRRARSRVDIFTFMQKPSDPQPKYGFPMEWDNLAVLPVSTYEHWRNEQIGFKARNKAKQAGKKGVQIREVPLNQDLARGIWEIYNEVPIRQGRRFPHFGKDYETVFRESATYPDHSVFIGAFFDGRLIGFIRLLISTDNSQAGLLNIVALIEHRDKSPMNALVAFAVRLCADRKIPHLTYSNFSYGRRQRDSLSDFKERNGFQRLNVPRYYIPLTLFGWTAFRLGLHRKLSDRVPEFAIVKFRELRNAWYERHMQTTNAQKLGT